MDQRQSWVDLRITIESLVSEVTADNVAEIASKLFSVNILRGRGVFCRSIIHHILRDSSLARPFAALACVLSSKCPEVGELLLCRVVCLFKRGYCQNKWMIVECTVGFICELTVQAVVDEILLLQILQVLIEEQPTDDSIHAAQHILLRAGGLLFTSSKAAIDMIFERLHKLVQGGRISTISQKRITTFMRFRRDGMTSQLDPGLDLVGDDEKETVLLDISQKLDPQSYLNYFNFDPNFDMTEKSYRELSDSISVDDTQVPHSSADTAMVDLTDSQLIQRQKVIYLTIMSSMSPDEAMHKLFKLARYENLESATVIDMIIKCCAQEKTYSKYFGIIGEKVCHSGNTWRQAFVLQFREKYDTIFQYEGAQLRNIGRFFGHLIAADALPLVDTLGSIVLTEDETSSAGRVFIKFLFQEMVDELGIQEVASVLREETVKGNLWGMFPVVASNHDLDHLMFSINYFTAIGLGVLTQDMRQALKNLSSEPRGRERGRGQRRGTSRSSSFSRTDSFSRSRSPSLSRHGARSRSFSRSPSPS